MILQLRNLSYSIEANNILSDINLTVNKGDFINILGPNGGGKTTLIKLITKIIKPTQGEIILNTTKIGYLPQRINNPANFPITVKEVLLSSLKRSDGFDHQINKWLQQMELTHLLNQSISVLSGGQIQRVYLIRALIENPDILILDEPTSALDPAFKGHFFAFINDLRVKHNTTVIHVTHDLYQLPFNNTKTIYLDQEIKYYGTTQEYLETRGHKHV